MDAKSIADIKKSIEAIEQGLNLFSRTLKKIGFDDTTVVAQEGEYGLKGLLGGINAVLIDCKALVNAPNQFIAKASVGERRAIATFLQQIAAAITATRQQFVEIQSNNFVIVKDKSLTFQKPDGSQIQLTIVNSVEPLENLKPILRGLGVRHSPERLKEIDAIVSDLQRQLASLGSYKDDVIANSEESKVLLSKMGELKSEAVADVSEIASSVGQLKQFIDESADLREELSAKLADYKKLVTDVEGVKDNADEILTEIKSNEGVVDQFAKRVNQREQQIEGQEAKTQAYEAKLEEYGKEQSNALDRAKALILEATNALKLSGSVALGRHFNDQYESAQKNVNGWLVGAGFFFLAAIALGIWLVVAEQGIYFLLGRLSLIPLALLGAVFCAIQYRQQRRIIEDYAYKKVLALSIQSFRDELSAKDMPSQVQVFMQSVIEQLHKSPLDGLEKEKISKLEKDLLGYAKEALENTLHPQDRA